MTDTIMEEAVRIGQANEEVEKLPNIFKRMAMFITAVIASSVRIMCVTGIIIGVAFLAVHVLTPDPWYVRMLPW